MQVHRVYGFAIKSCRADHPGRESREKSMFCSWRRARCDDVRLQGSNKSYITTRHVYERTMSWIPDIRGDFAIGSGSSVYESEWAG